MPIKRQVDSPAPVPTVIRAAPVPVPLQLLLQTQGPAPQMVFGPPSVDLFHKKVFALPTAPKAVDRNPLHYKWFFYGREKVGKTTLAASFPKALFLCTEPGVKGLEVYAFNDENGGVVDWNTFIAAVDLLEKNPGQFETIIIDTIDRAFDMCLDYVCASLNIEYPGNASDGKEDFGKSWRAVSEELSKQIYRLSRAGYGLVFISHAQERDYKLRGEKESYMRVFPRLGATARKVIEALVDYFFFADYVKDPDGITRRILVCQGDDTIWAGSRKGVAASFPRFLPLVEEGGYEIIKEAFLGNYAGLDPKTLASSRASSKAMMKFIDKARLTTVSELVNATAGGQQANK